MNIDGVTEIVVEPAEFLSDLEPIESYFKCTATKNGVTGTGIGGSPLESILDCLDYIESYIRSKVYVENDEKFPF